MCLAGVMTTTEELPDALPPLRSAPVSTEVLLERLETTKATPGTWKTLWVFPSKNTAGPRAAKLRALTEGQGFQIRSRNGELIAQYVGGEESKT